MSCPPITMSCHEGLVFRDPVHGFGVLIYLFARPGLQTQCFTFSPFPECWFRTNLRLNRWTQPELQIMGRNQKLPVESSERIRISINLAC